MADLSYATVKGLKKAPAGEIELAPRPVVTLSDTDAPGYRSLLNEPLNRNASDKTLDFKFGQGD